jgi:DNA invertase Pin-like site-specific DNA recombinase
MVMANQTYIAYYRVSTKGQGESGLGLEAQRCSVLSYLKGVDGALAHEYTEIESGTGKRVKHRPALQQALECCRKQKATLVIAKLDRLARNVAFTATLMESNVKFIAVDIPNANKLTIHILAAVAEDEAERISARTKAALAAAKARGTELGTHGKVLAQERRESAQVFAGGMRPIVKGLRAEGYSSVRSLTQALNARAIPTPTAGGAWHPTSVHRLLDRLSRIP